MTREDWKEVLGGILTGAALLVWLWALLVIGTAFFNG